VAAPAPQQQQNHQQQQHHHHHHHHPGMATERRRLTRSNPNAAPSPTTAALLVEQGQEFPRVACCGALQGLHVPFISAVRLLQAQRTNVWAVHPRLGACKRLLSMCL
jgi:hypothetical protein